MQEEEKNMQVKKPFSWIPGIIFNISAACAGAIIIENQDFQCASSTYEITVTYLEAGLWKDIRIPIPKPGEKIRTEVENRTYYEFSLHTGDLLYGVPCTGPAGEKFKELRQFILKEPTSLFFISLTGNPRNHCILENEAEF